MNSVRWNTEPGYRTQETTQSGGVHSAFLPQNPEPVILFQRYMPAHTNKHTVHTHSDRCVLLLYHILLLPTPYAVLEEVYWH